MTVSGVAVPELCGLLTRNRCPSLVTAYMLLLLTTPAGKSVVGVPGRGASRKVNRHRRHRPGRIEIEQLSAIGPPVRILSSIR